MFIPLQNYCRWLAGMLQSFDNMLQKLQNYQNVSYMLLQKIRNSLLKSFGNNINIAYILKQNNED
jgi:hypothetical protein